MRTFLILIFSFGIITVNSQIVYTDVEPDSTVSEFLQGYAVDFNNDSKSDVHLVLLDNVGVWVMRLIPDDSEDLVYVINVGGDDGGAAVLNYEDNISSSSNFYKVGSGWGDLLYGHWDDSGDYGYWTETQEDKYLGIKFKVSDDFYYAWIHITTHIYAVDDMDFIMKGFAYNSVPNEQISAGDIGNETNISEVNTNDFSVYPNPASDIINLSGINCQSGCNMDITDISGKLVLRYSNADNNFFNISNLKPGVYFIKIQTGKSVYSNKFIKK